MRSITSGEWIVPQRNLLFQFIEGWAIHGLLASAGRIRQRAVRFQATIVGICKKSFRSVLDAAPDAQQTLLRPSANGGCIG
jgi:hypothetical protein